MSVFGAEVRRLRVQAKLTQDDVADRIKVTRTTISQIENGRNRRPGDHILGGLERVLGLSRMNSLALIAGTMSPELGDGMTELFRIAAMGDVGSRLAAWRALPEAVQYVLITFARDLVHVSIENELASDEWQLDPGDRYGLPPAA